MHLSVIVPAYNEEKNLRKTIQEFHNYLSKQNYDSEIIVINDGSTDDTEEELKKIITDIPNVKALKNTINLGKGGTVKRGLNEASGKYRLFIDADNATTIDHLDHVWDKLNSGYDVVIGSRNTKDVPGAYQKIKQPLWKRSLGILGNVLIQAITVPGIWDTQCGFKVFSDKAVAVITPKQTINRWAFDVELLVLARNHNLQIAKIPVIWENSDTSRVGFKGYFISLRETLKIAWNKLIGKYKPRV